jgi:hypothetical protein
MSETASATLAVSQVSADTYQYTITLTDTGSTPLGTFWFAWIPIPDENFLATQPVSVTPPAGWGDLITNNFPTDGFGIEYIATSSAPLQPGQSLPFSFESTDTPAAVEGVSTFYPGTPVTTSWVFQSTPQPGDGFQLVVLPCFCAGTRIATADGATPVEQLRSGDRVMLARGGLAPVVWLGRKFITTDRHPRKSDVLPVCVSAGAFGDRVPDRDLLLSPDHAIFVNGSLIPVRYLMNGSTIAQRSLCEVTYYHVELAVHDVILADGLPVESYLDTGNRFGFADATCGALPRVGSASRTNDRFRRRLRPARSS